ELLKSSIVSILNMFTSSRAETSAAIARHNINQQRRTNEQDDLINFKPREYDDRYASPTYPEYTIRSTTPIPIREVDDDCIVITDPDDIPVLPLHDIVTDNQYKNID
ncbi:4693_t:CDS:1, partial [Gigaspora margarita]